MNTNPYLQNSKANISIRIISIVFIVAIIAVITIISSLVRTDVVLNSVLKRQNINFLLMVSDDSGPLLSEAVIFNPQTLRLALIDIPKEAGDLLPSLRRSDRFSSFYKKGDIADYQNALENLLKVEFLFSLELNVRQLSRLVDLVGGLDLYFFTDIDTENMVPNDRYIFSAGDQRLDGEQVLEYLYLPESPEWAGTIKQRNMRMSKELVLELVNNLQEHPGERDAYLSMYYRAFQSSLNKRAFESLFRYLSKIEKNKAEVIFQDYLGKVRDVQGLSINFPVYNGEIIRTQAARIGVQLQNEESPLEETYPVRVEVLNGTSVARLASRTADKYRRAGFEVVNIDNADRSDYDKTVVMNLHSRRIEDVRRVAEMISAANVELQPLPGASRNQAEVRVILGKDFDGEKVVTE